MSRKGFVLFGCQRLWTIGPKTIKTRPYRRQFDIENLLHENANNRPSRCTRSSTSVIIGRNSNFILYTVRPHWALVIIINYARSVAQNNMSRISKFYFRYGTICTADIIRQELVLYTTLMRWFAPRIGEFRYGRDR